MATKLAFGKGFARFMPSKVEHDIKSPFNK